MRLICTKNSVTALSDCWGESGSESEKLEASEVRMYSVPMYTTLTIVSFCLPNFRPTPAGCS